MKQLLRKNIILGVTGSIAAYKSADLLRLLVAQGACVKVVLTQPACEFVKPLTFQALSGQSVHLDLLDPDAEAAMGHIELAHWAHLVLIAPATADMMSLLATGRACDLLTTLCLATSAPIMLAPAMNQGMWHNKAVQINVKKLEDIGISILGPSEGNQACGDFGMGRFLEQGLLMDRVIGHFNKNNMLKGRHVLITVGATRERIDPVRFISNDSSGKMGFCLAEAAVDYGARVTVVCGVVYHKAPDFVERIDVINARQMFKAVHQHIKDVDIFIGCAAVSDYRPVNELNYKIKKTITSDNGEYVLPLVLNPDIISSVASLENPPYTVGFAAETENLSNNARIKLKHKKLNMIVANDVSDMFHDSARDYNAVTVISSHNLEEEMTLPRATKQELSEKLIQLIYEHYAI